MEFLVFSYVQIIRLFLLSKHHYTYIFNSFKDSYFFGLWSFDFVIQREESKASCILCKYSITELYIGSFTFFSTIKLLDFHTTPSGTVGTEQNYGRLQLKPTTHSLQSERLISEDPARCISNSLSFPLVFF